MVATDDISARDITSAVPRLAVSGLSKSYPNVKAVDAVTFSVAPGEIHALLGENGAGKSTLVKMIYGLVTPDAGQMTFDGAAFQPAKPSDARARGVGMVFQHFSLFDALTVTENVALGLPEAETRGDLSGRIRDVSRAYGIEIDAGRRVGALSVGERQRIEIVRCLLQNPQLIIMDEPTSVLTPQEAGKLFTTLRALASEGRSILYISHKLEEIRALCSAATVLRGGRVVGRCDPRQETARSLAEMMIGDTLATPRKSTAKLGKVRLQVDGLSLPAASQFSVALQNIRFEVRAGEVLGIAGVAGNGQGELMQALIGERVLSSSTTIRINGDAVGRDGPSVRRALGAAFVPEERLGHGAVPGLSLSENVLLSNTDGGYGEFIDWPATKQRAADIIAKFGVRAGGPQSAARSLSGGNLQKFVVGREVLHGPGVFIASQPTWGVDAGAAAQIHDAIVGLAQKGTAVVVISQDLDELMQISTRIAVIANGSLSDAKPVAELTVEGIGHAMGGQSTGTATARGARHD